MGAVMTITNTESKTIEMKTEINNENKAKFKSLYYGQLIELFRGHLYNTVNPESDDPIELTPLSQISDEDAIAFMYLIDEKKWVDKLEDKKVDWGKSMTDKFMKNHLTAQTSLLAQDFFRSRGYALDWLGITVEEQIAAGWVKLKS